MQAPTQATISKVQALLTSTSITSARPAEPETSKGSSAQPTLPNPHTSPGGIVYPRASWVTLLRIEVNVASDCFKYVFRLTAFLEAGVANMAHPLPGILAIFDHPNEGAASWTGGAL